MPVIATSTPLSSRIRVTPRTAGGFDRVIRPDPNDAISTYRRNNGTSHVEGAYVSPQMPNAASNPAIADSGESALSRNINLAQRGRDTQQQYYAGEADRRAAAGNTGIAAQAPLAPFPMDARFSALLQALFETGASKLSTGAAHFKDKPGFFDVQNTRNLEQQALLDQLRASDINTYGRAR